jgi:hypothetical protein
VFSPIFKLTVQMHPCSENLPTFTSLPIPLLFPTYKDIDGTVTVIKGSEAKLEPVETLLVTATSGKHILYPKDLTECPLNIVIDSVRYYSSSIGIPNYGYHMTLNPTTAVLTVSNYTKITDAYIAANIDVTVTSDWFVTYVAASVATITFGPFPCEAQTITYNSSYAVQELNLT